MRNLVVFGDFGSDFPGKFPNRHHLLAIPGKGCYFALRRAISRMPGASAAILFKESAARMGG
jgi:hypothetical protein